MTCFPFCLYLKSKRNGKQTFAEIFRSTLQAVEETVGGSQRQNRSRRDCEQPARAFLWHQSRTVYGRRRTSLRATGKSFLARALAQSHGTEKKDAPVEARSSASLAAEVIAALKGAHIIRTHDVKAAVDALRIADLALD